MATIGSGKNTFALGAFDTGAELYCFEIGRPEPGPTDVAIDIQVRFFSSFIVIVSFVVIAPVAISRPRHGFLKLGVVCSLLANP